MPKYSRSKMCSDSEYRPKPVIKRPRKNLTEEEKEEAKIKRAVNKVLRANRKKWEATLPKPWIEGANPFRHPTETYVMFKSDAKKAFSLTEGEILTLPHESIPGSFKTYFALADAQALQQRKLAAGALLNDVVKCDIRVLKSLTSTGRRGKANFWEFFQGSARMFDRYYGPNGRITQAQANARGANAGPGSPES